MRGRVRLQGGSVLGELTEAVRELRHETDAERRERVDDLAVLHEDGVIDEFDRRPIGKPNHPQTLGGLSLGASYKGFDLNILFQGANCIGRLQQITVPLQRVHRQIQVRINDQHLPILLNY